MTVFFAEYGLFLAKVVTLLIATGILVLIVGSSMARGRRGSAADSPESGDIVITKYNECLEDFEEALSISRLEPAMRKQAGKERKARDKAERKAAKLAAKKAKRQRGKGETLVPENPLPRTFVLDFDGDIRASSVEKLRREITAVLTSATSDDEVLLRLDSGGGTVNGYGLGAAQLDRIRKRRIPLVICVDKVAASGGYMMACVADKIIAAPFAMVGSIGVVAQIPNVHRLLKKWDIDVELLTAGKFKRTLTMFGENNDEGRAKFIEDIERIHAQFKQYVSDRRPKLDIERVATGEVWSGTDLTELGLVDELGTSDERITESCIGREVLIVTWREKRSLMQRFSLGAESAVDRLIVRWLDRMARSPEI